MVFFIPAEGGANHGGVLAVDVIEQVDQHTDGVEVATEGALSHHPGKTVSGQCGWNALELVCIHTGRGGQHGYCGVEYLMHTAAAGFIGQFGGGHGVQRYILKLFTQRQLIVAVFICGGHQRSADQTKASCAAEADDLSERLSSVDFHIVIPLSVMPGPSGHGASMAASKTKTVIYPP